MDHNDHATIAAELKDAAACGKPVDPLTERFPEITVDDAYAIQLLQIRDRIGAGATIKGYKVGLTSAAMQQQLGVREPDFGHLLDDMFCSESTPIPVTGYLQPRAEPETAFVLGRDLSGPGVTVDEAAAAVAFVAPALEIIDSRIRDWRIALADTIADNASSAGVVLGATRTPLDGVDLPLLGCLLAKNGELVGTGAGGAVLGTPIAALAWLANTLGPRGVVLRSGDVVLPGSVTAAVPVTAGDTVTATFHTLGSVTATFADLDPRR